jgi:lipoprotein-anchoring transpeptidase ErfK/SrfK
VLERIGPTTAFGSPQTLSVVADAGRWLKVTSERLPTGATAWIDRESAGLTLARTPLSIVVRLSARTLELRSGDTVLRRFRVGVGASASPTPTGRFAVTDKLTGTRYGGYYGCCILALTASQTRLPPGWLGGDRVAIHGTSTLSTIGEAASAGCLRAADANLEYLMATVPLGTPVVVRP